MEDEVGREVTDVIVASLDRASKFGAEEQTKVTSAEAEDPGLL